MKRVALIAPHKSSTGHRERNHLPRISQPAGFILCQSNCFTNAEDNDPVSGAIVASEKLLAKRRRLHFSARRTCKLRAWQMKVFSACQGSFVKFLSTGFRADWQSKPGQAFMPGQLDFANHKLTSALLHSTPKHSFHARSLCLVLSLACSMPAKTHLLGHTSLPFLTACTSTPSTNHGFCPVRLYTKLLQLSPQHGNQRSL